MVKNKTILIVDDHPLFREGLKSLIARNPGFEVAGEAGSGGEGLQLAEKLKPDLVVMDISLPDKSGIEVTRSIRGLLPHTHVMIVSMHSKIDHIIGAFQAGATGYLVKDSASEMLLQGLDSVSKGEYFLDSSVSNKVVQKLVGLSMGGTKISDAAYGSLSPREQEVLRLLAEGLSSKEIAQRLFISSKTVDNHRANIMAKLDLHSNMELVRYAVRLGLVDVDLWKD